MAKKSRVPRARALSQRKRKRFVEGFVNLPDDCLKAKLAPLLSTAETKGTFLARIGEIYPRTNKKFRLIERSYDEAQRAFRKKRRDNGDAYFEHLRASAVFAIDHLCERRPNVIAAILLHDILEDFPEDWSYDRLVGEFNRKVAELVWWVTKPAKSERLKTDTDIDRSYYERLRRAPRKAIIIKLVDRLHNLTTIWGQSRERIQRKVDETKCYVLPLSRKYQLLIHELDDVVRHIEECLLV